MKYLVTFGLNDLKNIRRDSLLIYLILVPWLLVLLVRLLLPEVTNWFVTEHGFDLIPYYPLVLSFFFILQIPFLSGLVFGFLLLDEKDERIFPALQVTPVSLKNYIIYRFIVAVTFTIIYVLATLAATGFMEYSLLPKVVPVALVAGLIAVLLILLLIVFANNKVEGLAITKAFGILLLGPLAAFFVESKGQALLGILPTYWPAKAFWLISEGESAYLQLFIGAIYLLALIVILLKRFEKRIRQL